MTPTPPPTPHHGTDPGEPSGLLRTLLRLVLVAAVVTAPVFVFGEGFEARYVARVAASNGICVALCLGLLRLLRRGRAELVANLFVFGLLALVGALAWFNGERVHVNVVNFVLVAVLAAVVTDRRVLRLAVSLSALEMVAIAWTRPFAETGQDLFEARFEAVAQFLPTYLVIAAILWLRTPEHRGASRQTET